MRALVDLPDLVGFFSYSRDDDADHDGALTDLRERIQREVRAQLGRSARDFRLWQDKEEIAPGKLWEAEITAAVAQSVFFIPIITPTTTRSDYCRFEFETFLARERALERDDLVFPILYIRVPALEDEARRKADPLLSMIAARQYVDWQRFRHMDVGEGFRLEIQRFCGKVVEALVLAYETEADREAVRREAEARRVEAERLVLIAAASRVSDEQSAPATKIIPSEIISDQKSSVLLSGGTLGGSRIAALPELGDLKSGEVPFDSQNFIKEKLKGHEKIIRSIQGVEFDHSEKIETNMINAYSIGISVLFLFFMFILVVVIIQN